MRRPILLILLILIPPLSLAKGFYGSVEPIPQKIQKKMIGYTWHKGCPLPLNRMSYLTLSYYGFDHKNHIGHIIVLDNLALETLNIFKSLYLHKFPIASMVLPYTFKSKNDWVSTEHNNTSGFFCRKDAQSPSKFSAHSEGIAIDINPLYNPAAISPDKTEPGAGKPFMQRDRKHPGMIKNKGPVVEIFTHYGWKWGGYWSDSEIDYMHFQKDMDHLYTCTKLIFTKKIKGI